MHSLSPGDHVRVLYGGTVRHGDIVSTYQYVVMVRLTDTSTVLTRRPENVQRVRRGHRPVWAGDCGRCNSG